MDQTAANKIFYATILAGILNNREIGGTMESKVKMAVEYGDHLNKILSDRRIHEPLGKTNLLG